MRILLHSSWRYRRDNDDNFDSYRESINRCLPLWAITGQSAQRFHSNVTDVSVFCPNWFFVKFSDETEKIQVPSERGKKDRKNFSSSLTKYSRSRDRGRGISLFYRELRIFELRACHLQGMPCLYIMYQTKDGEGAGSTSPGRYPCHVKFPLCNSFYFRILLNIHHPAWNCAGLSQRSWRVPSDPVKRSTGRSCLN